MMLTVLLSEIRSLKCSILLTWDSLIKILMLIHFWQGIAGVYRYNWDETTISMAETRLAVGWTDGLKVIRMEACLVWEELLIITTLHFG